MPPVNLTVSLRNPNLASKLSFSFRQISSDIRKFPRTLQPKSRIYLISGMQPNPLVFTGPTGVQIVHDLECGIRSVAAGHYVKEESSALSISENLVFADVLCQTGLAILM